MPYNISKGVVHRSLRYLEDMKESRKTLTWPTHDSKALAYKIREALYAAKRHPDFMAYHPLKDWFRIRDRNGWVEAEYIGPPPDNIAAHHPEGYSQPGVTNVQGVVGACIKLAGFANDIFFPNAVLNDEDKLTLFTWGKPEKWNLIDHQDAGVTMTRRRVEDVFFWKPEEE